MTENKLKNRVGLFMVISHFAIILFIIGMRLLERFDDDTLKVSLPIVLPLFASYSTAVVKNFIQNKHKIVDRSKAINSTASFISLFIPAVFILLIFLIVLKQSIKPTSVESFAILLGLGESVFGIYLGTIFKGLFPDFERAIHDEQTHTDPDSHGSSKLSKSKENEVTIEQE